jgi:hypothetical protein
VSTSFQRTDDRGVQTSFLLPNQQFTSINKHNEIAAQQSSVSQLKLTREQKYSDGSTELQYANGTRELVTADNQHTYHYVNADWRHVDSDGTEVWGDGVVYDNS